MVGPMVTDLTRSNPHLTFTRDLIAQQAVSSSLMMLQAFISSTLAISTKLI
jgi:hypothetical protein